VAKNFRCPCSITILKKSKGDLFVSEITSLKFINPWSDGDYIVYGYAIPAPDGDFWPAYLIQRVSGLPDAPNRAIALHQVETQTFATTGLAKMVAVSHGVDRVRTMSDRNIEIPSVGF
jgi:hypothetical protein